MARPLSHRVLSYRAVSAAEDGKTANSDTTGTGGGAQSTHGLGSDPSTDVPYIAYATAMASHYAAYNPANYADNDVHVNAGGFLEAYHSTIGDIAFHGLSENFGGANDEYLLAWCALADIKPEDSFGNTHNTADDPTYASNHDVVQGWGAKLNLAFFDSNDEKNSINLYHSTADTLRLRMRLTAQAVTDEIFDAADYISGVSETWDAQDNTAPMYDMQNAGVTIDGTTGIDSGLALLFHPFKNGHYRIDILSSFCDAPLTLRLEGHANNTGDSLRLQALQCGQTQLYADGILKLGTNFDPGNFKNVAEQLWSANQGVSKSMPALTVERVSKVVLNNLAAGVSGSSIGFGVAMNGSIMDYKYFSKLQPLEIHGSASKLLAISTIQNNTASQWSAVAFKCSESSLLSGFTDELSNGTLMGSASGTAATAQEYSDYLPAGLSITISPLPNAWTWDLATLTALGGYGSFSGDNIYPDDLLFWRTQNSQAAADGWQLLATVEGTESTGATDTLTDTGAFTGFGTNGLIGYRVLNTTTGEYGTVTANDNDSVTTAESLVWSASDGYQVPVYDMTIEVDDPSSCSTGSKAFIRDLAA